MMKRRNTPAKTAILELIKSSNSALSQDYLERKLTGLMDRVTIYRVLNNFCQDGIVHKVLGDDGKHYFALCVSCKEAEHRHHHFHFRCLSCNKVECLNQQVHFSIPMGYKLSEMNCLLTGYCANCAA